MKNDRRPEFEKDYVYLIPACRLYSAEELERKRCTRQGFYSYADEYLRILFLGWCISKDAEIKRHEQYTATRLALLDSNPSVQPYDTIRSIDETFAAPEGFKWGVNFVTANQWPQSATLVGGVQYSLHDSSGAPYVDVILFQTDNTTDEAIYESKALYRKLSDAFHVKTHFSYDEGGHTHYLTRLTIQHEEFVRLQNV
jgi:hypothetical protein